MPDKNELVKAPEESAKSLAVNRTYLTAENAMKYIGIFDVIISKGSGEDFMLPYTKDGTKKATQYLKVTEALKYCVDYLDKDGKYAKFRCSIKLKAEPNGITFRWKPNADDIILPIGIVKNNVIQPLEPITNVETLLVKIREFAVSNTGSDEICFNMTLNSDDYDNVKNLCAELNLTCLYMNEQLRVIK